MNEIKSILDILLKKNLFVNFLKYKFYKKKI